MTNFLTRHSWLALLDALQLVVREHNAKHSPRVRVVVTTYAHRQQSAFDNGRSSDAQAGRLVNDVPYVSRMGVEIRDREFKYARQSAPRDALSRSTLVEIWEDWRRGNFSVWHAFLSFEVDLHCNRAKVVTDVDRVRLLSLSCVNQVAALVFHEVPLARRSIVMCSQVFYNDRVDLLAWSEDAVQQRGWDERNSVLNCQSAWRQLRKPAATVVENSIRISDAIRVLSGRKLGAGKCDEYGAAWTPGGKSMPDVIWSLIAQALPSDDELPASVRRQAGLQLLMPVKADLRFANAAGTKSFSVAKAVLPEWSRLCDWLSSASGRNPGVECSLTLHPACEENHCGRSCDSQANSTIATVDTWEKDACRTLSFGYENMGWNRRVVECSRQLNEKCSDFRAFAADCSSPWRVLRVRFAFSRARNLASRRSWRETLTEPLLAEFARAFPAIADASDRDLSVLAHAGDFRSQNFVDKFPCLQGASYQELMETRCNADCRERFVDFVVYKPRFTADCDRVNSQLIGDVDWRSQLCDLHTQLAPDNHTHCDS